MPDFYHTSDRWKSPKRAEYSQSDEPCFMRLASLTKRVPRINSTNSQRANLHGVAEALTVGVLTVDRISNRFVLRFPILALTQN